MDGLIDYDKFINRYKVSLSSTSGTSSKGSFKRRSISAIETPKSTIPELPQVRKGTSASLDSPPLVPTSPKGGMNSKISLDKLYGNKEQLLCIFRFFDTDSSGTIDKEEFTRGIKLMQKKKPSTEIPDADHLWEMLDVDKNNEIDVNEFLEAFRVVDTLYSTV